MKDRNKLKDWHSRQRSFPPLTKPLRSSETNKNKIKEPHQQNVQRAKKAHRHQPSGQGPPQESEPAHRTREPREKQNQFPILNLDSS